jgi:hypothetical protein
MNDPAYLFENLFYPVEPHESPFEVYRFFSISETRTVQKVVIFSPIDRPLVVNLALMDVLEDGSLSDLTVTNNRDISTVLATVSQITAEFLSRYPTFIVMFTGSDKRRTSLYSAILTRRLNEFREHYVIMGEFDEVSEPFRPNQDYDRFYIQLIS